MDKEAAKRNNCPWNTYFTSIKDSCPWSLSAFMSDKILFVNTTEKCIDTYAKLFPHTKHEAYVYTWPGKSAEWLSTMSEGLNDLYPKSEWLWSHPAEGGESTPVPCLIQQDALQLNTIREKIGYDKQN